jgi:hypothetical protein
LQSGVLISVDYCDLFVFAISSLHLVCHFVSCLLAGVLRILAMSGRVTRSVKGSEEKDVPTTVSDVSGVQTASNAATQSTLALSGVDDKESALITRVTEGVSKAMASSLPALIADQVKAQFAQQALINNPLFAPDPTPAKKSKAKKNPSLLDGIRVALATSSVDSKTKKSAAKKAPPAPKPNVTESKLVPVTTDGEEEFYDEEEAQGMFKQLTLADFHPELDELPSSAPSPVFQVDAAAIFKEQRAYGSFLGMFMADSGEEMTGKRNLLECRWLSSLLDTLVRDHNVDAKSPAAQLILNRLVAVKEYDVTGSAAVFEVLVPRKDSFLSPESALRLRKAVLQQETLHNKSAKISTSSGKQNASGRGAGRGAKPQ